MSELVAPFKAWHYNREVIGNLDSVITPPYDVIPPSDIPKYLTRSPYNLAHVLLPKKENDQYEESAAILNRWKEKQVVVQDGSPGYYLYQQEFQLEAKTWKRNTLFSSVLLHDFADGVVRPHENTHGKYKKDRLQILRQTKMNLSPIFAMALDPDGTLQTLYEEAMFQKPILEATSEDAIQHRIWKLGQSYFARLGEFFNPKPLYIVDGHHRYESALQYARESGVYGQGDHPGARMLCAIANANDPSLAVFPTHRWLHEVEWAKLSRDAVEAEFNLQEINWDTLTHFVDSPVTTPTYGLWAWGRLFLVTRKTPKDELSVSLSDDGLLKKYLGIAEGDRSTRIHYERSLASVRAGLTDTELCVFHARPSVMDIVKCADANGFMPQKSTYFFPKLISGLLMRSAV